jgi:hypothetical protein
MDRGLSQAASTLRFKANALRNLASRALVASLLAASTLTSFTGFAQTGGTTSSSPPALGTPGVNCVISTMNRNAIVEPDGSYVIFGVPATSGAVRGRVTCSDGSIGQTPVVFTILTPIGSADQVVLPMGAIAWGRIDPVPSALGLTSTFKRLTTGSTAHLTATALGVDEASNTPRQYDVTPRSAGTTYSISNDLMGTVSENGLVTILPLFASGSTSRVVLNASAEGGATGSYMFILGPRGVFDLVGEILVLS